MLRNSNEFRKVMLKDGLSTEQEAKVPDNNSKPLLLAFKCQVMLSRIFGIVESHRVPQIC